MVLRKFVPSLRAGLGVAWLFAFSISLAGAQMSDPDPFASIKAVTKRVASTGAGYLYTDPRAVSDQLVRPMRLDTETASSLSDYLSNEQIAWQSHAKRSIDEVKLTKQLNTALSLSDAPEYLQIREDELRRIRVYLATALGDFNAGVDHRNLEKGDNVVRSELSPFEAFAAAGVVIYQKLYNEEFLRTQEEDQIASANRPEHLTPGLRAGSFSARQLESQKHFAKLWNEGFLTKESLLPRLQSVMENSRQ